MRYDIYLSNHQIDLLIRIFFLNTVKLGYNELGYNEHSVKTNIFLSQIGHISTQINPVITNRNGCSRAVRYNRV